MAVKVLLNYLFGYLNIYIEGFFLERFINACANKRIFLWKIKNVSQSLINANIGISEFKEIREIAKQTRCKIKIEYKAGIPFLLNRYKKRKLALIFITIIICSLLYISRFVWNIEIVGTEKISSKELVQQLQDSGLKIGMAKKDIDTKKVVSEIRLIRNDVAWIGIQMNGTNVIVTVEEATAKPEIINSDEVCNIVATKEGIIDKVTAKNGTALVKEGDFVKEGDIIIAGWIEGQHTGTRYVHAQGDVEARTWRSEKRKMALNVATEEYTGCEQKKQEIFINNFRINLNKSLPKFENYDTIRNRKKIKIFSDLYLPVEFDTIVYVEKEFIQKVYTIEEAKTILQTQLEEELSAKLVNGEEVINKAINVYENLDSVEVEVIYEIRENIGTEAKLIVEVEE